MFYAIGSERSDAMLLEFCTVRLYNAARIQCSGQTMRPEYSAVVKQCCQNTVQWSNNAAWIQCIVVQWCQHTVQWCNAAWIQCSGAMLPEYSAVLQAMRPEYSAVVQCCLNSVQWCNADWIQCRGAMLPEYSVGVQCCLNPCISWPCSQRIDLQ